MIPRLTIDDMGKLRMLLREVKLRIDPRLEVECRQLAGDPRVRKAYFARRGVSVDGFGELLLDRGYVSESPSERDVLELLELVLVRDPEIRRATAAEKRQELSQLDAEAIRARNNRLRKFTCTECGAIAYAARDTRISCGVDGAALVRVSKTFDEVMNAIDYAEVPF